ncbi:hypothetical protein AVEN_202925-1 [Araneus ventricosus]|uniref:Uncharacterized protein n=1 Tax=Araneus ventricosus TaxID=182803 RepID=A0A4Y2WNS3_ARAVE|nr:hypothetical protein AVEN_65474-1 [Araneus ventricosus]GBO38799.1 hypothetical protein AVEN_202925-1 [Araneus ventricosus]
MVLLVGPIPENGSYSRKKEGSSHEPLVIGAIMRRPQYPICCLSGWSLRCTVWLMLGRGILDRISSSKRDCSGLVISSRDRTIPDRARFHKRPTICLDLVLVKFVVTNQTSLRRCNVKAIC